VNLPFVYIILPFLLGAFSPLLRKKRLFYHTLLAIFAFSLGISSFILASKASSLRLTFTLTEKFTLLGRSLNVATFDLSMIGIFYLIASLWILTSFFYYAEELFPTFTMVYTALLIAAISIDPFLYSALILFLANALFLPVLSFGFYQQISGRMRFLVFQLLSVVLILLAGWILAGGEVAPVEEDQLFFSSVLLGCGLALWLGVFPFYTWIPLLAEEVPFFPFGFMLSMLPLSGILMLLKFLNNFAWLREFPVFYPALQYVGAFMIFLGGIGAFFQKVSARMVAHIFIAAIGVLLCSVGFIPEASTNLVAAYLLPFAFTIWSISLAMQVLVGTASKQSIEKLGGKLFEDPLHSLLLLSGIFTITGFPLFSGYAPNLLLLHTATSLSSWHLYLILGGETFLIMTGIRLILRLTLPADKKIAFPAKIKLDQILVAALIVLNIFQGIFPFAVTNVIFTALRKMFPLV